MSRHFVSRRFWPWARTQLVSLSIYTVWALGGALIAAVVRRTLRGRTSLRALATLVAGLVIVALWETARSVGTWRMWWPAPHAAGLLVAWGAGAVAARRTRDLAVLELQAAWLVTTGALTGALSLAPARYVWGRVSPWSPSLGEVAFGPLWDRALALFVACGFAVSLFGASCQLIVGHAPGEAKGLKPWQWSLEWRLLRRRLFGREGAWWDATSGIATSGVALGVVALIVVTAVMSGYQFDIQQRILNTNAHVVVQKYGTDFREVEATETLVRHVPGVVATAPFAFNEALMAIHTKSFGMLVKGVTPSSADVTGIASQVCERVVGQGKDAVCFAPRTPHSRAILDAHTGLVRERGLIVGLALFRALNVPVGQSVQVMTPASLVSGRHSAPRRERFVLRGVFDSGMHEFDSHLVYMALPDAQRLLGLGSSVSGIEVRVEHPLQAQAVAARMLEALGHYPYRALDWKALNGSIFTAIALQKAAMFVLLSFIVVVASFNIASTLMMAAMQRSKDMAILKSLGVTQTSVLRLFVFEGLAIASVGCALGLAGGTAVSFALASLDLSIAADVYMVGALTVRLDAWEVGGIVALAFAICQIASLLPALRASKESAMEMFAESV